MLTLEVAHVIVAIVVVVVLISSGTDFLEKRNKLSHQSGRS